MSSIMINKSEIKTKVTPKVTPKVTMIMLQSMNGKLAKDDKDDLKWGGKADKEFFGEITQKLGVMIMGSATFEAMRRKVLPGRRTIVMTSSPERYSEIEDGNFSASNLAPAELLEVLAAEGVTEVALTGGAKLSAAFLKAGLVDEIYLTIAPLAFLPGKDLLNGTEFTEIKLELVGTKLLDQNTINLLYRVLAQ